MKRILIACLVLAFAVSLGCGSKQEEEKDLRQETGTASMASFVDPVDGEPVDIEKAEYMYVYKDVEYYFNSEKNMNDFKKNPEKYLSQMKH